MGSDDDQERAYREIFSKLGLARKFVGYVHLDCERF